MSASTSPSSKGNTAQAARAGARAIIGAIRNRVLSALVGMTISLNISLTASAMGCSRPREADPVGADADLHVADDLALGIGVVGHQASISGAMITTILSRIWITSGQGIPDLNQCLHRRPPRASALSTVTAAIWSPRDSLPATPAGMRTHPGGKPGVDTTEVRTAAPFCRTSTRSPASSPEALGLVRVEPDTKGRRQWRGSLQGLGSAAPGDRRRRSGTLPTRSDPRPGPGALDLQVAERGVVGARLGTQLAQLVPHLPESSCTRNPERSSRLPSTRSTFQPGRASPGGATAPWKDCQTPSALTKVPEVSAKAPIGSSRSATASRRSCGRRCRPPRSPPDPGRPSPGPGCPDRESGSRPHSR